MCGTPITVRSQSMDSPAMHTWSSYSESAESLVHLTHEGLDTIRRLPDVMRELKLSDDAIQSANFKAEYAAKEIDSGFAILHAHSLLGLWGAMESLVEDLFLERLHANESLLSSEMFAKVRIPVSVIGSGDQRDKAVLAEASRASNAHLALGTGKFERLLEYVSLSGPVPKRIRDIMFRTQQVRNVWAHRAGCADQTFVERCPDLGVALGSRVDINATAFVEMMHGMHMYVVVLNNRLRLQNGQPALVVECIGYEGVLASADPEPGA